MPIYNETPIVVMLCICMFPVAVSLGILVIGVGIKLNYNLVMIALGAILAFSVLCGSYVSIAAGIKLAQ